MKATAEREKLLLAVQDSRRELRRGLSDTRQSVNITSRMESSVRRNLPWWIGGSLIAGICIASATNGEKGGEDSTRRRKLSASATRGFFKALGSLSRFFFSVSGPVLKAVLTREVIQALSGRSSDKA